MNETQTRPTLPAGHHFMSGPHTEQYAGGETYWVARHPDGTEYLVWAWGVR